MKPTKCKICKREDNPNDIRVGYYNIEFNAIPVCEICADNIAQQQLQHNFNKKWKSFRELNIEKKK